MNLAGVAVRNLARHPIRTGLTVLGVACAAATVFAILGFDRGYERALRDDLSRTGVHLFVSTEGCPSVAATMLIRGGELPRYMTDAHLAEARTTPGVRLAGGYLIATGIPPEGGGIDLFFGITEEVPRLKPEWKLDGSWFSAPDAAEAILGATMAERFRAGVGSSITIPSLAREVRVVGILERTRSQDDQFIFLPIQTAQRWFRKDGKLTAIGVQAESVEQIPAVKTALERIGRTLLPSCRMAVGEIKSPSQTVRADFPHTAYGGDVSGLHYAASQDGMSGYLTVPRRRCRPRPWK